MAFMLPNRDLTCRLTVALLFLAVLGAAPSAMAASKDPNKEAIRRLQIQLRQVEQARSGIEQEKSALAQELDALKKKTAGLESSAARGNRRSAKLEKELEAVRTELSTRLESAEKLLAETQAALKHNRGELQQSQAERQRLDAALAAKTAAAQRCDANNRKLYQYQVELINRAQAQGSFEALLAAEPVTQIGRVEIENILEEYRDKIDAVQAGIAPGQASTESKP